MRGIVEFDKLLRALGAGVGRVGRGLELSPIFRDTAVKRSCVCVCVRVPGGMCVGCGSARYIYCCKSIRLLVVCGGVVNLNEAYENYASADNGRVVRIVKPVASRDNIIMDGLLSAVCCGCDRTELFITSYCGMLPARLRFDFLA